MSTRLKTQLEEAKRELAARKATHEALQQANAEKVKAAKAKCDAAEVKATAASHAAGTLREKVETENKIMVYTRKPSKKADDEEFVDIEWHPDFLYRVAVLVGVHFNDRETVDPRNQYDSLYEQALRALRRNLINSHPEVSKLDKISEAAYNVASSARSELWSAQHSTDNAASAVKRTEREIAEIERKIQERADAKQAAVVEPASSYPLDKAEEKAKTARAKLRDIIEKKLTIPLEPK